MNRKRLFLAAALIFSLLATSATAFAGAPASFSDLKESNWAYDAVSAMSTKGIVKGYPDGTFKPSNTLTYGEFIKMALVAATGEDPGNAATGNWAANYYNKALELKYFTAADIATNDLGKGIDRAHMALIISSTLGDVKVDSADKILKGITDVTTQTKYEADILKAYASGILTGYTDKTFKPEKTLTRAEAATVIYRFVEPSKRVLPDINGNGGTTAYTTVNLRDYVDPSTVENVKASNTGEFTDKAWLYKDASQFNITLAGDQYASLNHTMNGFIYLVKDKKITKYCITDPDYDASGNFLGTFTSFGMTRADVKAADYILVTQPTGSSVLPWIVPNPFR